MPAAFRLNADKVKELTSFLTGMEHRVEDFSIPFTHAAQWMLEDVRSSFQTAGSSIGEQWAPHAQTTIDRWGEHVFGVKPGGGNLAASLHKFVRKFVCGVEATASHAHFFENGHHSLASFGTGGTEIKIRHSAATPTDLIQPAREFMKINPKREDQIVALLMDYALGEQGKAD